MRDFCAAARCFVRKPFVGRAEILFALALLGSDRGRAGLFRLRTKRACGALVFPLRFSNRRRVVKFLPSELFDLLWCEWSELLYIFCGM